MDNDCGWLRENDMYINNFMLGQVIVLNIVIFWYIVTGMFILHTS